MVNSVEEKTVQREIAPAHPLLTIMSSKSHIYFQNLKKQAQEMKLDFEKLANEDRKSARDMQATTRSFIPPVLAVGVTIGFFGILFGLMYGQIQHAPQIDIMLGSLGTAWTGIVSFYFGSSASSQNKDQLLHQSSPTP